MDASAIKRSYTIVGKGYVDFGARTEGSMEIVQEKAIKKAREKGMDAILFQDHYVTNDGNTIYSVTKTDSAGKGLIRVQNARTGTVITSKTDLLFLKYD